MTLKELQTQIYDSVKIGNKLKALPFIVSAKGVDRSTRLGAYKTSSFLKSASCLEDDFIMTKKFLNLSDCQFENFLKRILASIPPTLITSTK